MSVENALRPHRITFHQQASSPHGACPLDARLRGNDRGGRNGYVCMKWTSSRVAITLDIYSHVSLVLEKKAAVKLNAVLTGRDNHGLQ
jgi:hypothetical protein